MKSGPDTLAKEGGMERFGRIRLAMAAVLLCSGAAWAGDYAALRGVQGLSTVFDVSQGNPRALNLTFGAVRDLYQEAAVRALPAPPRVVVVFRGQAVRLLSADRSLLKPEDAAEAEKFAETLRQMKKDGVTLEVCDYARKVQEVDPAGVMPEVDRVDNGFVSVAGYQAQGYSLVAIP